MPWNEEQLKRTLVIYRIGPPTAPRYRLASYMRVTTHEGTSYMEPIPWGYTSLPNMGYEFDKVEFQEAPGSNWDTEGSLTHNSIDAVMRLTQSDRTS